jgi:hypothetical protein
MFLFNRQKLLWGDLIFIICYFFTLTLNLPLVFRQPSNHINLPLILSENIGFSNFFLTIWQSKHIFINAFY